MRMPLCLPTPTTLKNDQIWAFLHSILFLLIDLWTKSKKWSRELKSMRERERRLCFQNLIIWSPFYRCILRFRWRWSRCRRSGNDDDDDGNDNDDDDDKKIEVRVQVATDVVTLMFMKKMVMTSPGLQKRSTLIQVSVKQAHLNPSSLLTFQKRRLTSRWRTKKEKAGLSNFISRLSGMMFLV